MGFKGNLKITFLDPARCIAPYAQMYHYVGWPKIKEPRNYEKYEQKKKEKKKKEIQENQKYCYRDQTKARLLTTEKAKEKTP